MAPVNTGPGVYDALKRRQAPMGTSGPLALVNFKVFCIAMFACIGGLLYGYNQGVFGGILSMPSFEQCKLLTQPNPLLSSFANVFQIWVATMIPFQMTSQRRDGSRPFLSLVLGLVDTLLSGFIAESLSRKRGIMIATSVFIVGVVIQVTAVS
jgi:hypothetical protein